MIVLGEFYGGPEWHESPFEIFMRTVSDILERYTGTFHGGTDIAGPDLSPRPKGRVFEVGSEPSVNVVFYVAGSIVGSEGIPERIEAARHSRKQKWALVAVPVPSKVAKAGGSIEFVIDALHKANAIAADAFARKGPEPFNLKKADAIVDKAAKALQAREKRAQVRRSTKSKVARVAKQRKRRRPAGS
jgi:hypothetical protein